MRAVIGSVVVDVLGAAACGWALVRTQSASAGVGALVLAASAATLALLVLGGRRSRRRHEDGHPLGYGREGYFWGFLAGVLLPVGAAAACIADGVRRIDEPRDLEDLELALGALGGAWLLSALALWLVARAARRARGDVALRRYLRRSPHPELPAAWLLGTGAVVALLAAGGAVGAAHATEDARWDAVGTLVVGGLLVVLALLVAGTMKALLVGVAPDRKVRESVRAAIEIEPSVAELVHLRIQHVGPAELVVGAKVSFLGDLSVAEVAAAVERVETSLRRAVPEARIVYIEPDVFATDLDEGALDPSDVIGRLPPELPTRRPAHLARAEQDPPR